MAFLPKPFWIRKQDITQKRKKRAARPINQIGYIQHEFEVCSAFWKYPKTWVVIYRRKNMMTVLAGGKIVHIIIWSKRATSKKTYKKYVPVLRPWIVLTTQDWNIKLNMNFLYQKYSFSKQDFIQWIEVNVSLILKWMSSSEIEGQTRHTHPWRQAISLESFENVCVQCHVIFPRCVRCSELRELDKGASPPPPLRF